MFLMNVIQIVLNEGENAIRKLADITTTIKIEAVKPCKFIRFIRILEREPAKSCSEADPSCSLGAAPKLITFKSTFILPQIVNCDTEGRGTIFRFALINNVGDNNL